MSTPEGFHNRDADSLRLAPAVQGRPLVYRPDGIVSVPVVIGRIDAEHDHVDEPCIQHPVHDPRRVGGKPDMAYASRLLQLLHIVQRAALQDFPEVCLLVDAVYKAEVNVICLQIFKLPVHRLFDPLQAQGPAIFSRPVLSPKMHLVVELFPSVFQSLSVYSKGRRL